MLLYELVSLPKNIKDQCKILLEDPYVEGATPKELGILSEIRQQLPDVAISRCPRSSSINFAKS